MKTIRNDYVRRRGGRWCVVTKTGKIINCYSIAKYGSRGAKNRALKQLRAIEASKSRRDYRMDQEDQPVQPNVPIWLLPLSIERSYASTARNSVWDIRRSYNEIVNVQGPALVQEAQNGSTVWADKVDLMVDQMVEENEKNALPFILGIATIALLISNFNRRQWERTTNRALGIPPSSFEPWLTGILESFTLENQRIMRDLHAGVITNISSTIQRGIRNGESWSDINKIVKGREAGIFRKAANTVTGAVTQQVMRLNSDLTRLRQTDLGIKEYIWHTQQDNKVRDTHRPFEGTIQRWDSPPSIGHPGWDYNCRCWAEAYFASMEAFPGVA